MTNSPGQTSRASSWEASCCCSRSWARCCRQTNNEGPLKRVLVIGAGGSGKTTVARRLAERTGLPLIHLDALYWRARGQPAAAEEWWPTGPAPINRGTLKHAGNY